MRKQHVKSVICGTWPIIETKTNVSTMQHLVLEYDGASCSTRLEFSV